MLAQISNIKVINSSTVIVFIYVHNNDRTTTCYELEFNPVNLYDSGVIAGIRAELEEIYKIQHFFSEFRFKEFLFNTDEDKKKAFAI